jgi:hypothetical protein
MTEPTANTTTEVAAADDPARELLRWRYHPVREGGWRLAAVVACLIGIPALVGWLYGPFFILLALVILSASLGIYFLPTHYTLFVGGLETRFLGVTRRFTWSQFRSYYPDRNGVLLSPFPRPSRLENFRGLFVRFHGNREAVMAVVHERIPPPPPESKESA